MPENFNVANDNLDLHLEDMIAEDGVIEYLFKELKGSKDWEQVRGCFFFLALKMFYFHGDKFVLISYLKNGFFEYEWCLNFHFGTWSWKTYSLSYSKNGFRNMEDKIYL